MKNIAFFITHATLTVQHAEMTLHSLATQHTDKKIDTLYIYNTHKEELCNQILLAICAKYNLAERVGTIKIFDYDPMTPKTLAGDVSAIVRYCSNVYAPDDRILFLKSDSVLSVNFLEEILTIPDGDIYFVAPFVCAKARIGDEAIAEYAKRPYFDKSDEITFFVEDEWNTPDNDFNNRPGVNITDPNILFTACRVNTDFSCHFITNWLTRRIDIHAQTWGGVKFHSLRSYYCTTDKAFVIHKYHGIESENRTGDREGPVKDWLNS